MRKILLTTVFLLISFMSFGCTCLWGGNFIKANKDSRSDVVTGKVIGMYYLFGDKEVLDKGEETDLNQYSDRPFKKFVRIKIEEVIKGNVHTNTIDLYSSFGFDCTEDLSYLETDKWYVISLITRNDEFRVHSCSENILEYFPKQNMVTGKIKGNFKKSMRFYNYDKLKRKIS